MRASAGGADECSGGTASASSNTADASRAFNNSTTLGWTSSVNPTFPVWLRYSFAAPVEIVQVLITAVSTGSNYQYSPKSVDVQYSDDGTTWTTAFSASGLVTWSAGTSYTITQGAVNGPARVTAQSLEVLSSSASSLRVTSQSLEVLTGTYEARVAKTVGYAVLDSAGDRIGLAKTVAYAVLDSSTVARVSKAVAYAVLHDPSISTVDRRRPVIAAIS